MESNKTNISNLDFISIKSSLVDFLSNQEEFSGYSFEGSSLNILMDLLAYNTYYNGIYNNLVLNESFIDSAYKRSSVVSLAKNLGYTPKSSKGATAKVNIKLSADLYSDTSPNQTNIIERNRTLKAINPDGTTISFVTKSGVILEPYEYDENGEVTGYAALDVELLQGIYTTFSAVISDPLSKIKIPYNGVDLDTVRAFVIKDIGDTTGLQFEWVLSKNITSVTPNSRIFFISETTDGFYEIQFGDGIFGKKLEPGNVILIEFLVTSGSVGNNVGSNDSIGINSSFSLSPYEVETVSASSGGADREETESIRRNSIRNFSTQDRAVTATDYEAVVLKNFSAVESIRCWGGEDNNPPEYGKIFMSVKPVNAPFLTKIEKDSIVEILTENMSTVGMSIVILDPDILFLNLNLNIKYDPSLTNDSEMKIREVIEQQSKIFASENYVGFDDDFYASEFVAKAVTLHPSIVSVNVMGEMEKRVYPTTNLSKTYVIDFENEIYHPEQDFSIPSIKSSSFFYTFNEFGALINRLCYIEDLNGILKAYYMGIDTTTGKPKKIYFKDIGTVDYTTGRLIFTISIAEFSTDGNYIALIAKPKDDDIFTDRDTTLSFDKVSNRNITVEMKKVYKNTVQSASSANRTFN